MLGIFLDTETNGLEPFRHRILDVAYQVIDLITGEKKGEYQSFIKQPKEVWSVSNPDSLKVNGFTYETIQDGKSEAQIKTDILAHFEKLAIHKKNSVFICQNPSFDRVFLSQIIDPKIQNDLLWPYHWLDLASMYWAIYVKSQKKIADFKSFSKDMIASDLNLPRESKPHRAMRGAEHLRLCYEALIGFPEKKV